MLKFILTIACLINLVKSHGLVVEPAPRTGTTNGQGCFLDMTRNYYSSDIYIKNFLS